MGISGEMGVSSREMGFSMRKWELAGGYGN